MERYHMSKQTFYNTVERYKDAIDLPDFMDESKTPKNPYRKILPEHEKNKLYEIMREMGIGENKKQVSNAKN